MGTKKNNIRGCEGRIKKPYRDRYIALYQDKLEAKRQRKAARALHDCTICERQENTTRALMSGRKKTKSCSASNSVAAVDTQNPLLFTQPSSQELGGSVANVTADPSVSSLTSSASSHATKNEPDEPSYRQMSLESSFANTDPSQYQASQQEARDRLTAAIGDWLIKHHHPHNGSEGSRFKKVLSCARHVDMKHYTPPNRNMVGGVLLDNTYTEVKQHNKVDLGKEAEIFGLSACGDGATVKKKPLVNVLMIGVNCAPAVERVADCSGHMRRGGKKDGQYIARLFEPVMLEHDPFQRLMDLIFFDGAKNVQAAGRMLEISFPRLSCLHGAEHKSSLFFHDFSAVPVIKDTIKRRNRIYMVFGSGTFHSSHAVFTEHAKSFNNGKDIGLLRATDTRMAGYFMAICRDLRMR